MMIVNLRAFVATITLADGRQFTTTIYGSNAHQAEETAREAYSAARVIVRAERIG